MKRVILPLLVVAALVAITVAGYWPKRPVEAQAVACVDPLAGCTFSHRGAPVAVRFSVQPAPLEAFELSVRAPGARRISAEFQMKGMDMGFNRYDLRATNGAWAAQVRLPVCVNGLRDWTVYLDVDGVRYALPFKSRPSSGR